MFRENTLSRITIDISREAHKRLKATAALHGKTMREIIIEAIEKHIHHKKRSRNLPPKPNTDKLDKAIDAALEKYATAYKKITKVP